MGIYEKAEQIAERLGRPGEWSVAPGAGPDRADLRGPNNILLHFVDLGGRVRVTWLTPETEHELLAATCARHEITVSTRRDAAAMAGEVSRRLLPKIRRALAEPRTRSAAEEADHERQVLRANVLRALLSPLAARLDSQNNLCIDDSTRGVSGSVAIQDNDTVTVELTVPKRLICRFAAAIGRAARRA